MKENIFLFNNDFTKPEFSEPTGKQHLIKSFSGPTWLALYYPQIRNKKHKFQRQNNWLRVTKQMSGREGN